MFKNNLVLSVKSNNKFFRETDGSISIPFGSEYSLYIKNLDSRRAVINRLSIDGEDVISGNKLVIEANSILELEGFMDGSQAINKFKFIERTNLIEDHRGIRPDDGLIVLEFDYEKIITQTISVTYIPTWIYIPYQPYIPNPSYIVTYTNGTYQTGLNYGDSGGTYLGAIDGRTDSIGGLSINNESISSYNVSNDSGITVKGDDISQNFHGTYVGLMENNPTVISIKLLGFSENKISKPVFTHDKIECQTCGTKSKNNNKFCSECGTRLIN